MKTLLMHFGKVLETDNYSQSIKKIKAGLISRANKVAERNTSFSNFPKGSKGFEKWSVEISNAAQLIDYNDYDWQQAAVNAIILQKTNAKLHKRALQEDISYDFLMTSDVAKEQEVKGAAALEKANDNSEQSLNVKIEEEVGNFAKKTSS